MNVLRHHRKSVRAFTIVELLIVIVVIAVLATISVVAYNGIQVRARYSSYQNTIKSLQKAILIYQADKGYYPYDGASGSCWTTLSPGGIYIPGLAPSYINALPPAPNSTDYWAYCWTANGVDYKILRIVPGGTTLPQLEMDDATAKGTLDPVRPTRAWGMWSAGCSATC